MINTIKKLRIIFIELRKSGKNGISLQLRLLAFLFLLVVTIVLGFIMILMLTGIFDSGKKESEKLLKNELYELNKNIDADFGKLSRQGIELSEQLAENIKGILHNNFLESNQLFNHPELIETILDHQLDYLLTALKSAKSSGAYIILNSSISSSDKEATMSRAGIYLKSTEPNIINSIDINVRYLRGPASIARSHTMELMPQWTQEFQIEQYDFYNKVIDNAADSTLPLSRLYYWDKQPTDSSQGEAALLLAVPLLAEDGTIYGICGFEVSSMLFKLAYSPDNTVYPRIFATLSPIVGNSVQINNGLIAGNYYMTSSLTQNNIAFTNRNDTFFQYISENDNKLGGLHQIISLYPQDSVYADQEWIAGIIMPEAELDSSISSANISIYLAVCLLFLFGMLLAILISNKYIKPIINAFEGIKTNNYILLGKTKILEIDDLFEFLALQDEKNEKPFETQGQNITSLAHNTAAYESFIENIKCLSPAEKAVFDLYIEGNTAKEITEKLYLSINTIKTHNKRIYEKLNVSSRKELLVYIKMMKELNP